MMTDINFHQLEQDIFDLMMTEKALMIKESQSNNHNNPPEEVANRTRTQVSKQPQVVE